MASARPNMRDMLSKFTKAYNWVEISIRYMYHQVSWAPRLRNFFQIIVSKGQFKPRLFQGPVAWVCYRIGGSIPYIECKIFQASIYYRLLSLHDIETEAQHSLVLVSGPLKRLHCANLQSAILNIHYYSAFTLYNVFLDFTECCKALLLWEKASSSRIWKIWGMEKQPTSWQNSWNRYSFKYVTFCG